MEKIILFGTNNAGFTYLKEQLLKLSSEEKSIEQYRSLDDFYKDLVTDFVPFFFFIELSFLDQAEADVLRQLREEFQTTPIVIICSFAEEERALGCISKGAQSYLYDGNYTYIQLNKTMQLASQHLAFKNENEAKSRLVENILDTITDCFYIADRNWTIRYWNKAAALAVGKSRNEVLGKSVWEIFFGSGNEELYANFEKAMNEQVSVQFEHLSALSAHWYEVMLYPSKDGLSVYFRDITKRKQIDAERELMIKELTKSNNDLKQFSFITSHNIRAPLSNLQGILNVVNVSKLDDENKPLYDMLQVVSNQLSSTINDLTRVLIIKNKTNVPTNCVCFEDLFDQVRSTFLNINNDIPVKFTIDFRVEAVDFSKMYLESIFINLMSNSIKFRRPNQTLQIDVSTYIDENQNIVLAFHDNGIGMDLNKVAARLFGMYQRFHDGVDGQGLGLFIINSQITALGGTITAESEVGGGTTFFITFNPKEPCVAWRCEKQSVPSDF